MACRRKPRIGNEQRARKTELPREIAESRRRIGAENHARAKQEIEGTEGFQPADHIAVQIRYHLEVHLFRPGTYCNAQACLLSARKRPRSPNCVERPGAAQGPAWRLAGAARS